MIKLALALTFLSFHALGEYRVYQYIVKNNLPSQQTGSPLIRISTLDPVSFKAYHGGDQTISVDLMRTWICPGNTGRNKDICASPYEKALNAAINTAPNTGGLNVQ